MLAGIMAMQLAPSAPAGLATYANPNAYLTLTDSDRRAVGMAGSQVGNCFSSAAILEKTYFEQRVTCNALSISAGAQLYGGTATSAPTDVPLGQWNNEPGLTVIMAPTWALILVACYGLPEQISGTVVESIEYAESVTRDVAMAYDPATRAVWVGSTTVGSYVGGGNPALGTSPTIIMPGTSPMRFGGASNATAANSLILDPADYTGGAMIPAGFRLGVAA